MVLFACEVPQRVAGNAIMLPGVSRRECRLEIAVYGISACDNCRKARKRLDDAQQKFDWHDMRAEGMAAETVQRWIEAVGVDRLVNRRSATWRSLDQRIRDQAMDPQTAAQVLADHPTLIKRPVIEANGRVGVGFDDSVMPSL